MEIVCAKARAGSNPVPTAHFVRAVSSYSIVPNRETALHGESCPHRKHFEKVSDIVRFMEKREALEVIKDLTGEENLDPQTAQTMINDYHQAYGRRPTTLTVEQYNAVYWASTQGEKPKMSNPKKPEEMDKNRPSNFSRRFHRPR